MDTDWVSLSDTMSQRQVDGAADDRKLEDDSLLMDFVSWLYREQLIKASCYISPKELIAQFNEQVR